MHNPVGALYAVDPVIRRERWRFDPTLGGLDGLARSMSRLPLVGQAGDHWHYSMSLEVAGMVIERASGEPLDDFMKGRLFEPLRMNDTTFSVASGQADRLASLYGPKAGGGIERIESGVNSPLLKTIPGLSGGGGLVSTIDDYSRFAEMLRRGGQLDGRRVLPEESTRAMMTNQLSPNQLTELPAMVSLGLGGVGDGLGFGLGGVVVLDPPASGVPAFRGEYSWGGGASTTFGVDIENQVTVVFMSQLQPPRAGIPRDMLHAAVYEAMGLARNAQG
jgi:CubicO group peptidase (beta-lactamase class C family)